MAEASDERWLEMENDHTERELTIDELDAVSGGADDQYKESIHIDSWSWTGWTGTGGGGLRAIAEDA
jgi:hypothetical protein